MGETMQKSRTEPSSATTSTLPPQEETTKYLKEEAKKSLGCWGINHSWDPYHSSLLTDSRPAEARNTPSQNQLIHAKSSSAYKPPATRPARGSIMCCPGKPTYQQHHLHLSYLYRNRVATYSVVKGRFRRAVLKYDASSQPPES